MTDKNYSLPVDLYDPNGPENEAWQVLDQNDASSRLMRIDLVGKVFSEEIAKGKNGAAARTSLRLSPEGKAIAATTITDSVAIFTLFRTSGDEGGLGYSREQLSVIPFSRLRAVASRRDWALRHKVEIPELLSKPEEGEDGIKAYISASLEAEGETIQKKAAKKPEFVTRKLRMTSQDSSLFDLAIGILNSQALKNGETLSENADIRSGQLVLALMSNWCQSNADLVSEWSDSNPDLVAKWSDSNPELAAEVMGEAADDIDQLFGNQDADDMDIPVLQHMDMPVSPHIDMQMA